jgi:hypothetical protein
VSRDAIVILAMTEAGCASWFDMPPLERPMAWL